MVAAARRQAAKYKKLRMIKARNKVKMRVTHRNHAPVVRVAYREWDDHAMECALSELAECTECKNAHLYLNITKTTEEGGIPRKNLARYLHTPDYFDSQDSRHIITDDDEEDVVQYIITQHAASMALTHTHVKWLLLEIVERVNRKAHTTTGMSWIAHNRPDYKWYRKFMQRHSDRIKSRVVESIDPKRWKVSYTDVEFIYTIMEDLRKTYPDLPSKNIANLDETNLTPERRKSRVITSKGARRTHTLCNVARFSMAVLLVVFGDGSEEGKRRPNTQIE
jgi:hypothetical protein